MKQYETPAIVVEDLTVDTSIANVSNPGYTAENENIADSDKLAW